MHVHLLLAASRLRDGTPLVSEEITPLDGDISQVVIADKSDDGGRYVKNATFDHGRPIETAHVPTVWERKPSKNPMRDVMSAWNSALFVSGRFRDLLEGMEPGKHQFLPARIETGGQTVAEMFYFVVGQRLDALDKDACVPPITPGDRRFAGVKKPGDKLVFDARKIAGAHVWHDARSSGRFMSEVLRDACVAAEFEGIDFGTPIEISNL